MIEYNEQRLKEMIMYHESIGFFTLNQKKSVINLIKDAEFFNKKVIYHLDKRGKLVEFGYLNREVIHLNRDGFAVKFCLYINISEDSNKKKYEKITIYTHTSDDDITIEDYSTPDEKGRIHKIKFNPVTNKSLTHDFMVNQDMVDIGVRLDNDEFNTYENFYNTIRDYSNDKAKKVKQHILLRPIVEISVNTISTILIILFSGFFLFTGNLSLLFMTLITIVVMLSFGYYQDILEKRQSLSRDVNSLDDFDIYHDFVDDKVMNYLNEIIAFKDNPEKLYRRYLFLDMTQSDKTSLKVIYPNEPIKIIDENKDLSVNDKARISMCQVPVIESDELFLKYMAVMRNRHQEEEYQQHKEFIETQQNVAKQQLTHKEMMQTPFYLSMNDELEEVKEQHHLEQLDYKKNVELNKQLQYDYENK